MFCAECGQLVPQSAPSRPPAPFATPAPAPERRAATPAAAPRPIDPVPLPSLLPWQQAKEQAAPAAAPAQQVAPRLDRIELQFSTGQRVIVGGAAVIGRKPAQTAAATGAQAIEVVDDTRSVSRVHLYLELADGRVTVADAGSSNGSSVERDGVQQPLPSAGARVEVRPGDRVWVGDLGFQIRAAS
ncbi:FHA domain-containing protein [Agromyces sp. LHK192]|uniref:FHA domain-containing protein n=1 Tax=Agromyces sp. LHK192 TaxID=2498704 RepID=UPI000FDC2B74|nr:FHA domain-containing protein [Agromyces sp. LHK192]